MRDNKKIILISGWYGFGNLGDEAILYAICNKLNSEIPNADISVLSFNPDYNISFQQVKAYYHFPYGIKRWIKALLKASFLKTLYQFIKTLNQFIRCDVFILGGGGFLSGWQPEGPWFWLKQALLAKFLGKKVMIYGIGAGPFIGSLGKWLTSSIINNCVDIVTVRDEMSKSYLISAGVLKNHVIVSADPALSFPFVKKSKIVQNNKIINIGICVGPLYHIKRYWPGKKYKYNKYVSAIAETVDMLVEQKYNVFFIPMQKDTDEAFARDILAKSKETIEILTSDSDICSTVSSLTRADVIIAMRCHAAILSAAQGIPVVGIVYHHKVSEFLMNSGLISFSEEIGDGIIWNESDISSTHLVAKVNKLVKDYNNVCNDMNNKIVILQHKEKLNISCLKQII
jgi:polysaccharide pyruvyl transferase CsaB